MTLFSADYLHEVFPEATPDALQDPNKRGYEQMARTHTSRFEATGRLAMTGGNSDAIGPLLVAETEAAAGAFIDDPEVSQEFREIAQASLDQFTSLLDDVGLYKPSTYFSDLREKALRSVNWHILENDFNEYRILGHEPRLFMGIEGMKFSNWWDMFVSLCSWQKDHPPEHDSLKLDDALSPSCILRIAAARCSHCLSVTATISSKANRM